VNRGLGLIRRGASSIGATGALSSAVSRCQSASASSDWRSGYEDLNDNHELRKAPVFAVLAGKLKPMQRDHYAPVANKSTLDRLECTPKRNGGTYHKIDCNGESVD
jgi:hypothetical protein